MTTKEQTWRGLKLELSHDEISKICQATPFQKDKYYDFNLLMEVLHKTLNKELDFEYFKTWCILVGNSFNYIPGNRAVSGLYGQIGYMFDGYSFMEKYDKKKLLEAIASLKYYNHLLQNKLNKTDTTFTTNNVARILLHDHCNWTRHSSVYKVIVIDYNKKEFDQKFVDDADFEYDENINYSFVDEEEYADIFGSFYYEEGEWIENHDLQF